MIYIFLLPQHALLEESEALRAEDLLCLKSSKRSNLPMFGVMDRRSVYDRAGESGTRDWVPDWSFFLWDGRLRVNVQRIVC